MTYLLDINVLIAIFDTEHVHHPHAHHWFEEVGEASWATCPITENGFIRILSNPAYRNLTLRPADAADGLRRFCRSENHVFWQDSVSLLDTRICDLSKLNGPGQTTDYYLTALAAGRGGKLATFDERLISSGMLGVAAHAVTLIETH